MNTGPGPIRDNIRLLRERIFAICARLGRSPDEVTVVAVSKGHPAQAIQGALLAGVTDIGENRVQEAEAKKREVAATARWHLVGHLQSNKARKAVALFDVIQSVDTLPLAVKLAGLGAERGKPLRVLIEVKTSREATKFGVASEAVIDFAGKIRELFGLQLEGLMTVGPLTDESDAIRHAFQTLKGLLERINAHLSPPERLAHLSMGMTADYEIALEEGATLLRIGTAIFGPRP